MIDCHDSSRPLYKKTTDELGELLFGTLSWASLFGPMNGASLVGFRSIK